MMSMNKRESFKTKAVVIYSNVWEFPKIHSFTFSTFLLRTSHIFSKSLMTLAGLHKKEDKTKTKKGQQPAAASPIERQHNKSQAAFGLWLWLLAKVWQPGVTIPFLAPKWDSNSFPSFALSYSLPKGR